MPLMCGKCPARPYVTRTKCWDARLNAGGLFLDALECPRTLEDMQAEWWTLKGMLDALGQAIAMRETEERAV